VHFVLAFYILQRLIKVIPKDKEKKSKTHKFEIGEENMHTVFREVDGEK